MSKREKRAQHAPGPWQGESLPRLGSDPVDHIRIITKDGGQLIAGVPADHVAEDDTEVCSPQAFANARLIAAAPDLLEALASVLSHAERWAQELSEIDERTGVSEHSIEAWRAVESARAAIAKARGES